MAKLVFGMNQSLDGYVDHMAFAPSHTLFRHFIEEAQGQAGSVYGRQMYEVMRYWDDDHPEWDAEERAFAAAWRNQPKWVVSRSLKSVGPNARLVEDDLEGAIRELKRPCTGSRPMPQHSTARRTCCCRRPEATSTTPSRSISRAAASCARSHKQRAARRSPSRPRK